MRPSYKAAVYVTLAALEPLSRTLAVGVEKAAWPSVFEWTATGVAMMYAGLLVLKAWSSDNGNGKQQEKGEA